MSEFGLRPIVGQEDAVASMADRLSSIVAVWYPFCWAAFFLTYLGVWVARALKAPAKKPQE